MAKNTYYNVLNLLERFIVSARIVEFADFHIANPFDDRVIFFHYVVKYLDRFIIIYFSCILSRVFMIR